MVKVQLKYHRYNSVVDRNAAHILLIKGRAEALMFVSVMLIQFVYYFYLGESAISPTYPRRFGSDIHFFISLGLGKT